MTGVMWVTTMLYDRCGLQPCIITGVVGVTDMHCDRCLCVWCGLQSCFVVDVTCLTAGVYICTFPAIFSRGMGVSQ